MLKFMKIRTAVEMVAAPLVALAFSFMVPGVPVAQAQVQSTAESPGGNAHQGGDHDHGHDHGHGPRGRYGHIRVWAPYNGPNDPDRAPRAIPGARPAAIR